MEANPKTSNGFSATGGGSGTTEATRRLRWRRTPASTFVTAFAYSPAAPGSSLPGGASGFLHVRIRGRVYSYAVPAWCFGLLCAALKAGRSIGRAYNNLVKGRPCVAWGI